MDSFAQFGPTELILGHRGDRLPSLSAGCVKLCERQNTRDSGSPELRQARNSRPAGHPPRVAAEQATRELSL
jgi:hypothetical protein